MRMQSGAVVWCLWAAVLVQGVAVVPVRADTAVYVGGDVGDWAAPEDWQTSPVPGLTPGPGVDVQASGAEILYNVRGVVRDLDLDVGVLTWAEDLEVAGVLRWQRGAYDAAGQGSRLVAAGGLEILGEGAGVIDAILENRADATLHGFQFGVDGELVNAAGARFDVGGGRLAGIGKAHNHGLFTGAGIVDLEFANHGEVRVDAGRLRLGDLSGSGRFEVAAPGELVLVGGALEAGTAVESTGLLELRVRNEGHVDVVGGELRLLGASMNAGRIDVAPSARLRVAGGGQDADGALRVAGDAVFEGGAGGIYGGSLLLEGDVSVEGGAWRFAAPEQRLGTVLSGRGLSGLPWIEVAADGSTGRLDLERSFLVVDGARLDVDGLASMRGGLLALDQGTLAVGAGPLLAEGTHVYGTGTLGSDLVLREVLLPDAQGPQHAILAPGFLEETPVPSPGFPMLPTGSRIGSIVVQGDLLLDEGSRLDIQLGGDGASGVANDTVLVVGEAELAGALSVSVLGDAALEVGEHDVFVVLEAGAPIVGSFDGLSSGDRVHAGAGTFQVFYGGGSPFAADQVVLTGFQVPEPGELALLAACMSAFGLWRRRSGWPAQRG